MNKKLIYKTIIYTYYSISNKMSKKKMSKLEETFKKDYDEKLSNAKKQMLDKILKLRPELEKNKHELYDELFEEPVIKKEYEEHETVLDVLQQNNNIYYIDNNTGRILNSDVKQVGIYNNNELVLFKDNKIEIKNMIHTMKI